MQGGILGFAGGRLEADKLSSSYLSVNALDSYTSLANLNRCKRSYCSFLHTEMLPCTGSTSTRNGHYDPDCRTVATDRQQISNSAKCTPCVLSRRRRDGGNQGPTGDYSTSSGCFVSSATNHAASSGRADPHSFASTSGAQRCFDQPAAENLGIADRDPAERGGGDGGRQRRQQLPRAAADCGGRIRTARSARRLPHQADCDDASRRGRRDRWAGVREVGADCASDWTRWSTAPNRGFPRRGTVHH